MINTSMYERKQSPDLAGNFGKGFTLGQMIKDSSLKNEKRKKEKSVSDFYKENVNYGEDGSTTLKEGSTLGSLASIDPMAAQRLGSQMGAFQNQRAQSELSNQRKKEELGYKRDRLNLDRDRFNSETGQRRFNREQSKSELDLKRDALKLKEKTSLNKKIQPKADQFKVGGFAKRAIMAEKALGGMSSDVGTSSLGDTIQGFDYFPEALKSDDRKQFEQVQRNFISAVLRRESGAAISDKEMENEARKYFPMPGDNENVLALKKQSRDQAILNLKAEAGGAMDVIANAELPSPGQQAAHNGMKHVSIPGAPSIPGKNNPFNMASDLAAPKAQASQMTPEQFQMISSPARVNARQSRLQELLKKQGAR